MGRNSSYYSSGRGSSSSAPRSEHRQHVDKNPIYRTNDTFKRAYRKNISVKEGQYNQTDCTSTIWVRFCDPIDRTIVEVIGHDRGKGRYLMDCGHVWEGKKVTVVGGVLPCYECGSEQGYLGFEHEWQHILFKTDPKAAKLFLTAWTDELHKAAPNVDRLQLEQFLFYVLNAFDDIRCNSLWELLYAGSADRIWQRWHRISSSRGAEANSVNFIAFLFAVALGTPTVPNGPYEQLRPYIEWGMSNVKYKGYKRALVIARMAVDRCMSTLLALMQPPPPAQTQGGQNGQEDAGSDGQDGERSTDGADAPQQGDGGGLQPVPIGGAGGQEEEGSDGGGVPAGAPSPDQAPQPQDQGQGDVGPVQASNALSSMLRHAAPFDDHEQHSLPEKLAPTDVPEASRAAASQAINAELGDPQLEIDLDTTAGFIEPEMQDVIDQFRDGVTQLSPDSQLMADGRARIVFIDVTPQGIQPASRIVLTPQEDEAVERMQSMFFRTLGKQKAQRSDSGISIDIDAAIQYEIEPSDPEVFEREQNNQGFAYLDLCDMSGSMAGGPFRQVCHATEMLKKSLQFPFVHGSLWGFRGGDHDSEVWLYRYAPQCSGYIGTAKIPGRSKIYPVDCGGLTPMHSAVRVAVRHLISNVSSGMSKHLFLLTDGSPCSVKVDGNGLPSWILQQYVAKEIQWARQHGIQVYTLVIGDQLEEKECRQMFGPPRFWKRVSTNHTDEDSIEKVLQSLVIQNFERYLRSRG